MENRNVIKDKSFGFAIRIVRLYQYLTSDKKEYVLSKQLLRCGTSIGANINEALQGFTKKDFIYKLSIALKEATETQYWLALLFNTNYLAEKEFKSLEKDIVEIIKLLTSIIKSSKVSLS